MGWALARAINRKWCMHYYEPSYVLKKKSESMFSHFQLPRNIEQFMIRLGNFPEFFGLVQHELRLPRSEIAADPPDLKMQRMEYTQASVCMYTYTRQEECKLCLYVWLHSIHLLGRLSLLMQAAPWCMQAARARGARNSCYWKPQENRVSSKTWLSGGGRVVLPALLGMHMEACRGRAAEKILIKPDWCCAY